MAVRTVVYRLLDLLSDAKERKDLAKTRSAEAGAVEVLAETTSENDPASTELGYAMTLGRTGGLPR